MQELSPHEHLKIAKRLHFQGHVQEAISEYELVLELEPHNEDAIAGLQALGVDLPERVEGRRGPEHAGGLKTSFFVNQAREGHKSMIKQGPFKVIIFLIAAGSIYGAYQIVMYMMNFDNIKAMQNLEIHFEKPVMHDDEAKVTVHVSNFNPAPVKNMMIGYEIYDDKGTVLKDDRFVIGTRVPAGDKRIFPDITLGTIKGKPVRLVPKPMMLKYGPLPKLKETQIDKFIDAASKPDKDSFGDFGDFVNENDDFAPGWVGLGRAYAAKGQWKRAVEQYKKALEYDPDNYNAHYYMAVALYYMGNKTEAKKEIDLAATLAPDDPSILFSNRYLFSLKDQRTDSKTNTKK